MATTKVPGPPARRATVVLGVMGLALTTALALAGPAAAIADPGQPSITLTHGPSCGPGVVRLQVVNGDTAGRVSLVFDGAAVQDAADLAPGEAVELRSSDVDWGTTVDVSVRVVAADGSRQEPVEFGTYTRPTHADCDAVAIPADPTGPALDVPAADPVGWLEDDEAPVAAPEGSSPIDHERPAVATTAAADGAGTPLPVLAGGVALLLLAGGLGRAAVRRPRAGARWH